MSRERRKSERSLACYCAAPDLDAALRLVGEIGEHPAAASLAWIAKLRQLVNEKTGEGSPHW
jgi:hypothetical protein